MNTMSVGFPRFQAVVLGSLLLTHAAYAQRGGGYFTTARVTFQGPSNLGTVLPNVTYTNTYTVTSSPTTITAVGISGDSQFTLNSPGCVGATACTATASFTAAVGGDYHAVLSGSAGAATRVHAGSGSLNLYAHVAGANYTLATASVVVNTSNSDAPFVTGTFTLASTGESDLHLSGVTATDGYGGNRASIASNTCVGTIARGTSCQIVVHYDDTGADEGGYYSITVGVTGDTKPQPPVTVMGSFVLP